MVVEGIEGNSGYDFRGFGLESLGRFRKFAKLKIVLKVENRSCGRFLFCGAFVVAGLDFCRCVRVFCGSKLVLFFLPLFGGVFWGLCGLVGDSV